MTEKGWRQKIKNKCREAGTYRESFDVTIENLAIILAKRDELHDEFLNSGESAVMEYTNKNGSTNLVKNPVLTMMNDYNTSALAYLKELGLTPAGLKRLNESVMKEEKGSSLEKALAKLGGI